jgi:hypothetical protein
MCHIHCWLASAVGGEQAGCLHVIGATLESEGICDVCVLASMVQCLGMPNYGLSAVKPVKSVVYASCAG